MAIHGMTLGPRNCLHYRAKLGTSCGRPRLMVWVTKAGPQSRMGEERLSVDGTSALSNVGVQEATGRVRVCLGSVPRSSSGGGLRSLAGDSAARRGLTKGLDVDVLLPGLPGVASSGDHGEGGIEYDERLDLLSVR